MDKYSDIVVDSYINGEEIKDFEVDELENDVKFMMLVLDKTNDKNICKLCSKEVLNNETFVKYVIGKFSDDVKLLDNIAQSYLYHLDNIELNENKSVVLNRALIAKMMADVCNGRDNDLYKKYSMILMAIYSTIRVKVETEKKSPDNDGNEELGYGFEYFKGMFGKEALVLDAYAARMVTEIVDDHLDDIETMLHDYYVNFEDITDLDGDLLQYLDNFDKPLVKYLCRRPEVLHKGYEIGIDIIKSKWITHDCTVQYKIYDEALREIHDLVFHTPKAIFSEEALLVHFGFKYNVIDKVIKYDNMSENFANMIREEFNDLYMTEITSYSSPDRDLYGEVDAIFRRMLRKEEMSLNKKVK